MGRLVQSPATAGANREHPTSRSRGKLLCSSGKIKHGRVTKINQPPANKGRFTCAVVGKNYFLNQRVAKIEGKAGISKPFVYWSFSNSNTTKELENLAYGVAQLNLSPVKLSERPFVRPASKTIDEFSILTQPMFDSILSIQKQNQTLTKARDLLLPRLMDGRIAV